MSPGCPEIVEVKSGWCAGHDPWKAQPWRSTLPPGSRLNGWAWNDLRRKVRKRDGHRCVKCGRPGNEVDHIVPVARCAELGINAHDMTNLQTLCADCHSEKSEAERVEGMRRSRESRKGRR